MTRGFHLGVAAVCYVIFFATFLYLIAFTGDLPFVARTVDNGPAAASTVAALIDAALIALFGVQHSVMARPAFKRRWTAIVPPPVERSVYVLTASLLLILLFALWRPIPAPVWTVTGPAAAILWLLFAAGWGIVLVSTFLINHFELFGLQQAWLALRGRATASPVFRTPFFYRAVRHPLYSGFFLAFWSTPRMTLGHLLLATGMSAYMLLAIRYEEHDLTELFGRDYDGYRARVGMLVPGIGRRG